MSTLGWAVVASTTAAGAVWVGLGPAGGLPRLSLTPAAAAERRGRAPAAVLAVLVLPAAAAWVGGGAAGVLATVLLLLGGTAGWLTHRHLRRSRRERARAEVAAAADALAGLLRAGRVPSLALVEAAREVPVLADAAAESQAGGDVVLALRRTAGGDGREGLAHVAEAWQLASRTGAPLSGACERAAESLAGHREVARTAGTELAAARSAGRVLATLPLAGLGLGHLLGGDPWRFLLAHPLGWTCLGGGTLLACAGVLWTEWIADRAGRA